MTVIIEGENSFFLGSRAHIIEDERETASEWASNYIRKNPAIKWILGRYVEADNPNRNKQFWSLESIRMARPTIDHGPMNMLHRPRHVVGTFVASELLYPKNAPEETAAMPEPANPYVEALGAFWKYYFPEEFATVNMAHNEGSLFYSMECVSSSVTCAGENGCGETFDFAGPKSESYCEHLNSGASIKELNNPHFLGGALIIPPERPGWAGAEVRELSSLIKEHQEESEGVYKALAEDPDFAHLDAERWETMMLSIMQLAKEDKS